MRYVINKGNRYNAYRIVLAGQSTSFSATEGTVPVYLRSPMINVDGKGHNVYIRTRNNSAYEVLEYNLNNAALNNLCGQELIMGYLACKYYESDIYIDKVAFGGRPLAQWQDGDPDVDLNPTIPYYDWNTNSVGELYDELITNLTEGNAYFLSNGIRCKDIGLFWSQGQRDARAIDPNRRLVYKQNLLNLSLGVRAVVNEPQNFKFVTCVLNDNLYHATNDYLYKSDIQQAQRDFALENENCFSHEMTPYQMELSNLPNQVHYPVDSNNQFATDIFNKFFRI